MKPAVDPVLLACSVAILALGCWMSFNPRFRDVGNYMFAPVVPRVPWAPGSVDGATSFHIMLRIACLLGVTCFVCDLSARRVWRHRVWRTIAATGISLVLFGLFQSAFAKPLLFWDREDTSVPYFATYYYHGNAGAFINLVLPLVAGLAALTLRKRDSHFARAIWLPGFFICVAGAFVNVSRSAMVVTVLLCSVLLAWQFHGSPRDELLPPRRLRLAYAFLMIGAVVCLVAFSGWERPAEKWTLLQTQLNAANKRFVSTEVCLRMIPDAGAFGFAPGPSRLFFPITPAPRQNSFPASGATPTTTTCKPCSNGAGSARSHGRCFYSARWETFHPVVETQVFQHVRPRPRVRRRPRPGRGRVAFHGRLPAANRLPSTLRRRLHRLRVGRRQVGNHPRSHAGPIAC